MISPRTLLAAALAYGGLHETASALAQTIDGPKVLHLGIDRTGGVPHRSVKDTGSNVDATANAPNNLSHAPDNAAVAGRPSVESAIEVEGYAVPGDGGGHRVVYDSTNACGAGGHPAADGVTCINSTVSGQKGSWNIDWSSVHFEASTALFGAICDGAHATQDTAAFQAAAATGRDVFAPALGGHCNLLSAVTLPNAGQRIRGQGRGVTNLYPSATPFSATSRTITGSIAAGSDTLVLANGSAAPNPGAYITGTGVAAGLWVIGPSPSVKNGYELSRYNQIATQTTAAVSNVAAVPVMYASGIAPGQAVTGTGVPTNTTVSSVSGTMVTLSANVALSNASALFFSAAIPSETMTATFFPQGVITTGANGQAVEDLSIIFTQPAKPITNDALTTYEPGIKATGPGFAARRVNITLGSKCIDAGDNTNAGQDVFDDIQTGCFVNGITLDGALDSVRISKHHHWPYFDVSYQNAFFSMSVAVSSGRTDDLHISDSMCLSAICYQFVAGTQGVTFGTLTNVETDSLLGFDVRSGKIAVSGGQVTRAMHYLPVVSAQYEGVSGSFSTITFENVHFFDGSSPNAGTSVSQPLITLSGGGFASFTGGSIDTFNTDTTAIYSNLSGHVGIMNVLFFSKKTPYYPLINIINGQATIIGNYHSDSRVIFIKILNNNQHVVMGNSCSGCRYDFPSNRIYGVYSPNN